MDFARLAIFVLILGALFVFSQSTTGPEVGTQAPQFSAKTLSGRLVDKAQLEGKTVVVEFWATWCRACVSSLPALHLFYEQYGQDPSVEVFAVHVPKGASALPVKNFQERNGYRFPVVLDQRARLSRLLEIESILTLIVIAPNGSVHRVKNGALVGPAQVNADRIKGWVDSASAPDS